jgi:ectoine hydroxylase-related dioxygenase (phytanoyl-CoA dioxygenase family)
MGAAIDDIDIWSAETLATLSDEERAWYVDGGVKDQVVLRKLDNPHHHRPFFADLAKDVMLVGLIEDILGPGVSVYFSQIFFKPPRGGGPKPVHQDNFYFGPNDTEGLVTAWTAFDDATLENGCLYFGDGSNLGPIYSHEAPANEPFNLQIPSAIAELQPMTPAPVSKGGVSFHHGNTFHRSSDNLSDHWRRACAFHYVRNDVRFNTPALPYDDALVMRIT